MRGYKIFISLVLCFTITSCFKTDLNRSSVTEMWLNRSAIIIGSLEYYFAVNQYYPETLSELVPYYLSEFPVPLEDRTMLKYHKRIGSYDLSFEHRQPDYTECRYTPAIGWRCFGYE